MNNRKKLKKRGQKDVKVKKILGITTAFIIFLSLIFIGFSYFNPIVTEDTTYHTTGSASDNSPTIVFTDTSNGINLTSTYPMTNEEGMQQPEYTFNVLNSDESDIIYTVLLQTESGNAIANNLVSISLDGSAPSALNTFATDSPSAGYSYSYKIGTGRIASGDDKDFSLKAWLNEVGTIETVQNKNWYGKIYVKARRVTAAEASSQSTDESNSSEESQST